MVCVGKFVTLGGQWLSALNTVWTFSIAEVVLPLPPNLSSRHLPIFHQHTHSHSLVPAIPPTPQWAPNFLPLFRSPTSSHYFIAPTSVVPSLCSPSVLQSSPQSPVHFSPPCTSSCYSPPTPPPTQFHPPQTPIVPPIPPARDVPRFSHSFDPPPLPLFSHPYNLSNIAPLVLWTRRH